MDRNYDDQISFDELFLFLFPDHDEALAREIRRLKIVGDRVRSHGKLHGHHVEEESQDEASANPSTAPNVTEPVAAEPRIMAESGSFKVLDFKDDPDFDNSSPSKTVAKANKVVLAPL